MAGISGNRVSKPSMLLTSRNASSWDRPIPFLSAGRVATFQNSAMFWNKRRVRPPAGLNAKRTVSAESFADDWAEHCGEGYWCLPRHASAIVAFVERFAAHGVIGERGGGGSRTTFQTQPPVLLGTLSAGSTEAPHLQSRKADMPRPTFHWPEPGRRSRLQVPV